MVVNFACGGADTAFATLRAYVGSSSMNEQPNEATAAISHSFADDSGSSRMRKLVVVSSVCAFAIAGLSLPTPRFRWC